MVLLDISYTLLIYNRKTILRYKDLSLYPVERKNVSKNISVVVGKEALSFIISQ
jgi:hypothetical protein